MKTYGTFEKEWKDTHDGLSPGPLDAWYGCLAECKKEEQRPPCVDCSNAKRGCKMFGKGGCESVQVWKRIR